MLDSHFHAESAIGLVPAEGGRLRVSPPPERDVVVTPTAPFPNDTGKRKAGEHSQRKEKLPAGSFFRSLKMRLKPTKAQAVVLRRWMGAAQAHYNTAVDIINTTYTPEREDRYLEGPKPELSWE